MNDTVMSPFVETVKDRIQKSLWGIFTGDSLSMPVHWYYSTSDIKRDFGVVKDYQNPKSKHPSSIMQYSNTGSGGRGSNTKELIGKVILHDKRKFWGVSQMHYHQSLKAGDNTLNAQCARVVLRTVIERKKSTSSPFYLSDAFLQNYVKFMTTPGTHNDTYAESYHRDFFENYVQGKSLQECAGPEKHDTPSAGGLVTIPPVFYSVYLEYLNKNPMAQDIPVDVQQVAIQTALNHLKLTHRGEVIRKYASIYLEVLNQVILGKELRKSIDEIAGNKLGINFAKLSAKEDETVVGGTFSPACYIDSSLPSILYFAYKYEKDYDRALIGNANVGGDNCHRGSALGALLGAYNRYPSENSKWIEGLTEKQAISKEIQEFIN